MNKKRLPEPLKALVRPLYYRIMFLKMDLLYRRNKNPITDPKKIPIIINNRNRLSFFKQLIESLEKRGYHNIYIIDNASTYPPLLEYYQTCKYPIFRLDENVGCFALWETDIYKQFINDYFIYTDSDVVPIDECPDDFVSVLWEELKRNKQVYKIGLSLKIDDLPDCFCNKQKVIDCEKRWFEKRVSPLFYKADVDTTFALYKPGLKHGTNHYIRMYRSAFPYEARHLPWYLDSDHLPEEELFYIRHATKEGSTYWTKQSLKECTTTTS